VQKANGDVVLTAEDSGYDEDITTDALPPGDYYVRVYQSGRFNSATTRYLLGISLE
jgi:hypothetical protein